MPLIHHITSLHAGFITALITQLTWQLLNESPPTPGPGTTSARDGSYDSFIAAWAVYLLDTQTLSAGDEDEDHGKAKIIAVVMGGLGPPGLNTWSERKT